MGDRDDRPRLLPRRFVLFRHRHDHHDGAAMIPLVYIAAPYTHPDPVANTHTAIEAAELIEEAYNIAVFIPHLSLLWHVVRPAPIDVWYDRDLHILERCDAVYRLEGRSTGADAEVEHAKLFEIPVFYNTAPVIEIIEWRQKWVPRV